MPWARAHQNQRRNRLRTPRSPSIARAAPQNPTIGSRRSPSSFAFRRRARRRTFKCYKPAHTKPQLPPTLFAHKNASCFGRRQYRNRIARSVHISGQNNRGPSPIARPPFPASSRSRALPPSRARGDEGKRKPADFDRVPTPFPPRGPCVSSLLALGGLLLRGVAFFSEVSGSPQLRLCRSSFSGGSDYAPGESILLLSVLRRRGRRGVIGD